MPIFEYRCNECNEAFEVLKLSNKDNHTSCSACGSERVHRIISPVGIIFKGSGFYVTDSKKNSTLDSVTDKSDDNKNGNGSSEAAKNVNGSSDNGKTDNKVKEKVEV